MKYTIKLLEWEVESDDFIFADIAPLKGFYRISLRKHVWNWDFTPPSTGLLFPIQTPASSLSEAKAACQKHWEEQLKQYLIEAE